MTDARAFVFTVRQLTQYLKTLISHDRTLQDLQVRGEISDLTLHASGHIYLTLKDEFSQLRVVVFREHARELDFVPQVGESVVARGAITVYEPRGQYQLVATELARAGLGDLYLAFERLRRKLAAEGLFDEGRKRPLPPFPHRIAILTSPDGAAVHDMLTTLRHRWPAADVVLVPTPVSGPSAAPGILRSLRLLPAIEGLDVAILARGGGAAEEFAGFNTEEVARAIASAPVPIVTGIGHETDFTIADFVADHRAPTPTGAAAAATPDRHDLIRRVEGCRRSIAYALRRKVVRYRRELALLAARPLLKDPGLLLADRRQRVDEVIADIRRSLAGLLRDLQQHLARAADRMAALSPSAVLARGYSITRLPATGQLVRSVRQLAIGQAAEVVLYHGSADVVVRKLQDSGEEG
jgi:exodeoxyribonuclease VII large subunit